VPLVVQASLFDLTNGGDKSWGRYSPYADLGYQAAREARGDDLLLGSVGAGTGATTATVKGGLGSASMITPDGSTVAALVAANPIGSATVGDTGFFWAAPFEQGQEFGGLGLPPRIVPEDLRLRMKPPSWGTTVGIVATDAALTAAQAYRLAVAGQGGVARAVLPAHLAGDGDTIFAAATGVCASVATQAQLAELCLAATLVTARAIARAIFAARSLGRPGEQPCWHSRFGLG